MPKETPSYVDSDGKSSDHAIEMGQRFDIQNIQRKEVAKQTALERRLLEIAANELPDKKQMNWPAEGAYKVKSTDVQKGVLALLAREFPTSELNDPHFAKLAYGSLMKDLVNSSREPGKIQDVNVIEEGDQIVLSQGSLKITRKEGSKYSGLSLKLYPWGESVLAEEKPAQPESTETKFPEDVKDRLSSMLSKKYGAVGAILIQDGITLSFNVNGQFFASVRFDMGKFLANTYRPGVDKVQAFDTPEAALKASANATYCKQYVAYVTKERLSTDFGESTIDKSSNGGEPFYFQNGILRGNVVGLDLAFGYSPPFPEAVDYGQVQTLLNMEYKLKHPEQA